jgi:UDP-N-acetylmuramoyl-tripeptide--D-alanyl-D-alanine ligase
MRAFTVEDIVRGTQGALVGGDLGVHVTGVSIDTRGLPLGAAFFAIRGHHRDGHAFVRDAAGRGASCIVVHALTDELPPTVPVILVDDTTRALGRLAAWHRARFTVPVAAVTGSNGKTTTKEMMAAVLGTRGAVLKPLSSFNNQWGLPLTLLELTDAHRAVVLELGANQPGEIEALARISRPTVGAVTMISRAHTEFFGSLDGVQAEKSALVAAIPPEGAVVLNADDPRVIAMRRVSRARVLTVSAEAEADVRAVGPAVEGVDGLAITLEIRGARRTAHLRFAGRHNLTNALVAAGVGLALGLPLADIVTGLEAARPARGRCVWRAAGPYRILDDTYNANPASVRAALDTLAAATAPRRIVVLADMLELGETSEDAHRDAGRAVAESGATELIGVGRLARLAVEGARAAGLAEAHHAATFEDTMVLLLKRVAPGDAILIKGSRGMRMERVADALVARFGGGNG